jgi:hypothetical protein
MLAERRAAAAGDPKNEVSDAARKLGQRAAEARQERQAKTAAETQEPEEEQQTENTADEATPGDLSAAEQNQSETQEAETQEEPAEAQTIDFGDGISMPLEEVKQNLLRQADYTKKTQQVSERAKALDLRESQGLAQLDQTLEILTQKLGQPKTLQQFIAEDESTALKRYAAQEEEVRALQAANVIRERKAAERRGRLQAERDEHLAENYNKTWSDPEKRVADYTKLTDYALKLGATKEDLLDLTQPFMIKALDKAAKLDAIEAQRGKVTKVVSGKPPVIRPGTKVSAGAAKLSEVQAAQTKAKASGQLADAVALLQARRAARG